MYVLCPSVPIFIINNHIQLYQYIELKYWLVTGEFQYTANHLAHPSESWFLGGNIIAHFRFRRRLGENGQSMFSVQR